MLLERKKILIHRVTCLIILLISIITTIIFFSCDIFDIYLFFLPIIVFADVFSFTFFICSLLLTYKNYQYNEYEIIVYASWYHHYIKINGEKYDEHNTIATFTPIILSCTLDDCTDIMATITLTNRISLKINNKLFK